jgi:Family of unknown function (DUF6941)
MRLTAAILADYAAVREGVLHLFSGGINRLVRTSFPTPMGATLALMVSPENREDMQATHIFEISITEVAGEESVVQLRLKWPGISDVGEDVSPLPSMPIVAPTEGMMLPGPGLFRLTVSIDDHVEQTLEFLVVGQLSEAPSMEIGDRSRGHHS